MKQHGVSEQHAYQKLNKQVEDVWKDVNVGFNRSMQRKTAMVNFKKNLHKIIVWPRSIIEVYRFNNIKVFVTYL